LSDGGYRLERICTDWDKTTNASLEFRVEVSTKPQLIRVFTFGNLLNLLLNQEAVCEYFNEEFVFGEGTLMVPEERK